MRPYFIFFWHGETRVLFLHVLFETKYKPNETKPTVDVRHSHVKHCSHVEHRFLFSRITGERETLLMKHCSDVKHSSLDVNLCMSVEFVLSFCMSVDTFGQGWTTVFDVFAMFWMKGTSVEMQCPACY